MIVTRKKNPAQIEMNGPERSDSISVRVLWVSTTSPFARPTPIERWRLYTGTVLEKGCTKPNIIMPVEVHLVFKPSPQTWNYKKNVVQISCTHSSSRLILERRIFKNWRDGWCSIEFVYHVDKDCWLNGFCVHSPRSKEFIGGDHLDMFT